MASLSSASKSVRYVMFMDQVSWCFEPDKEEPVLADVGEGIVMNNVGCEILKYFDSDLDSIHVFFSALNDGGPKNDMFGKHMPSLTKEFNGVYGNVYLLTKCSTANKYSMDYTLLLKEVNKRLFQLIGGHSDRAEDAFQLSTTRKLELSSTLSKYSEDILKNVWLCDNFPGNILVHLICGFAPDNVWVDQQESKQTISTSQWTAGPFEIHCVYIMNANNHKGVILTHTLSGLKFIQKHGGRYQLVSKSHDDLAIGVVAKKNGLSLYDDGTGHVLGNFQRCRIRDVLERERNMGQMSYDAGHYKGFKDAQSVADEGEEKLHQKTLADVNERYERMVKEKDDLMTTRQNRWEKERHGLNARIQELESPASESERNQFQEQLAALSEKITRLENDINTKDDEISRLRLASPAKEKRSKAWVDTRKKRDRDDEEGGSGSKKPAGKKNKKGK
jgi:hypothetical protein